MIKRICQICKKTFLVHPCRLKKTHKSIYCSMSCYGQSKIGKRTSLKTEFKKGHKPANWNGGKLIQAGYIYILQPTHPFANIHGYVKRSRLVMEKKLGRYLKPTEVVHHINGIRNDDRPENLRLFANTGKHTTFHKTKNHLTTP